MNTYDLIINSKEEIIPLDKIHFSKENKAVLTQLLKEFKHIEVLKKHNLSVDNKLLLHGHTGCGKTTTARAIAGILNKKIITINLGSIVSSKLGETAKNITAIFKKATTEKAVLFIDEFDCLGKFRDADVNGSGEMNRLVNTIIQLIDHLSNDTLFIAATNHYKVIDTAILRRFQLKLEFILPNKKQLNEYYDSLLLNYPKKYRNINRLYDISYAEAKNLLFRAIKNQIIEKEEN